MKNFIAGCAWVALACLIGCACLLRAQSPTRGATDWSEATTWHAGFWVEEPALQELHYRRVEGDEKGEYIVCAAVGKARDGFFYVDIIRPPVAEKIQSIEVNTLYGAKLFAEKACR